jgi:hypothetical protein
MVGMFDIVGFQRLLNSLGLDGVLARVGELERHLRLHFRWEARFVMFSDTVLLYSHPLPAGGNEIREWARQHHVDAFLRWCSLLQALSLIAELPMRGGVALGECALAPSRGRLVGQPIADAYLLSEAQDWIGVALHESCIPQLLRYEPSSAGVTVRTKIPLKGQTAAIDGWTLDWPRTFPDRVAVGDQLSRQLLREALSKQVKENHGSSHAKRWLRTWEYFEKRSGLPSELPPEGAEIYLAPAQGAEA